MSCVLRTGELGRHLQDGFMVHVVRHCQGGHPAACRKCLLVAPDGADATAAPTPAAQFTPAPAADTNTLNKAQTPQSQLTGLSRGP